MEKFAQGARSNTKKSPQINNISSLHSDSKHGDFDYDGISQMGDERFEEIG